MRNVDYLEEEELEVIDFAPTTPEEAHLLKRQNGA